MNTQLTVNPTDDQLPGVLMDFSYTTNGMVYRIAEQDDDERLKSMLRDNPMEAWVQMTLEREPSYFAGEGLFGHDLAIIAEQEKSPHNPIGMYSYGQVLVHLNGNATTLGYVGHLRVNKECRNRIRVLKCGYDSLKNLTRELDPPFMFTSIATENKQAKRILNANLNGMPVYTPQCEFETLAISTLQRGEQKFDQKLQQVEIKDVADLVTFYNRQASQYQFSPHLTEEWLLSLDGSKGLSLKDFLIIKKNEEIVCCMAVWDQRPFKQTVARGYRFPINLLRSSYNLFARLTNNVELPAVGRQLEQIYLAFLAFEGNPGKVIIDAVYQGLAKAKDKGAKTAVIGLSAKNPMTQLLKTRFKSVVYRTEIETLSWAEHSLPLLDSRLPQPEAALL